MPGKGPLRRSEGVCPHVSCWTRTGQRRRGRRTPLPCLPVPHPHPPPTPDSSALLAPCSAPTQGTRPDPGHLSDCQDLPPHSCSCVGTEAIPTPFGARGTMCWPGGPTMAGTKTRVPLEWMGNKPFCPRPGTVRSSGGGGGEASWTLHLDPRTTSGDQTVLPGRPGRRARGRRPLLTSCDPPRKWGPLPAGPASPALRGLVASCGSPRGPRGDITSEVSPAAAAPHPGPLPSEETPPPHTHGHTVPPGPPPYTPGPP